MRLRLTGVTFQPSFVIEDDDGNLSDAEQVQPVKVRAADVADLPAIIAKGQAQLQAQLDAAADGPE